MKQSLSLLLLPLILSVPARSGQQESRTALLEGFQSGEEEFSLDAISTPLSLETTGENAYLLLDRTDGAKGFMSASQSFVNYGAVSNHTLQLISGASWRIKVNTDNSIRFRSGARLTRGGNFENASSREFKEDVIELALSDAIEAVGALRPVRFRYKADGKDEHVGFIAEDVPGLVAGEDRTGLSPMDIAAVLTRVVQDQQRLLEDQRLLIADLCARVEALEASGR